MDYLSFIFSLLLIVSVSTTIFGSAIKAKNLNGEVNNNWLKLLLSIDRTFCLQHYMLKHNNFVPFYEYELRVEGINMKNVKTH